MNLAQYFLVAPIGGIFGLGLGALIRANPKTWVVVPVALIFPGAIFAGAVTGRAGVTYVLAFFAGGLLILRPFEKDA